MVTYNISADIKLIRDYYHLTQEQFSKAVHLSTVSIARYETGESYPEPKALEMIYSFPYNHQNDKLRFNEQKVSLYLDDSNVRKLLFHGARGDIVGDVDTNHSIGTNDFGKAFYAGESLKQASTWVAMDKNPSVYCFYFLDEASFKHKKLQIGKEWMMAVLHYRHQLGEIDENVEVKELIQALEECDYLIAPVADNQMYQTLDSFAKGEITDEQCLHCLSATNLGMQYVFKNERVLENLTPIDRLYLSSKERDDYLAIKKSFDEQGASKVRLAKTKYRREGKFIDEYLK